MPITTSLTSPLEVSLLQPDGSTRTLREAAGGRPLLAYFMRTADCPACKGHLRELVAARTLLDRAGVRVVAVVPDTPAAADGLRASLDLPFAVLADPSLEAFRSGGLGKGFGGIQRSGAIGFSPDGRELFAHRSTVPLRKVRLEALIQALEADRG